MRTKQVVVGVTIALIIAMVTGGVSHTAHGAFAHATGASGTQCQNIQLGLTPLRSSGGAGHLGILYRMHNISRTTCTLYGYPGAVLLDSQFHSLPTTVTRGIGYLTGNPKPRLVTIKPGGSAYVAFEWSHIPTRNEGCPRASYIMITPPNDRLPDVTYAGFGGIDACGGRLTATPVAYAAFNF